MSRAAGSIGSARDLPYSEVTDPDVLREEIGRRDRKIASLKRECRRLQSACSDQQHRVLRNEARRLRKALSFIAWSPTAHLRNPREVAQVALIGSDPESWPGESCRRCGRPNVVGFQVPDEVWERVVGDRYEIVCLTCFDGLAAPLNIAWESVVELHPVSSAGWAEEGASATGAPGS